ncbi:MAG TPA: addiction module toxin, HicA family [Anaerolineae bacterium]|nr:addiction module toxin, HicA family [Anaerolineae bacterium]
MSSKIPAFKYREIVKRLRKLGFVLYRQGKGSHEIWRHPDGRWTTVPNHGSKTISQRTMKSILDDIGMNGDDFRNI